MRPLHLSLLALALAACSSKGPPGAPLPASHWDDPAWRRDVGVARIDLPTTRDATSTDALDGAEAGGDAALDGGAGGDASRDAPADSVDASVSCGGGLTACGGACFDTQRSTLHCGACGNACALQGARAACVMGRCAVDLCFSGAADCDGQAANGCEVSTATDPDHCGACGRVCESGRLCAAGACVTTCPGGTIACGRSCVDTSMTIAHCGACGRRCEPAPGGVVSCRVGQCAVSCAGSRGDCDGLASNGCEVDTSSSPLHCGRCGSACPTGGNTDPSCVNGACSFRCRAGFDDCDANPANGCEADLSSDLHCGRCGAACGSGLLCAEGSCVGACPAGRARCGGACVELSSSGSHCGACGNACRVGERCIEGACASTTAPRSCETGDMSDCALVEVPAGSFRIGSETRTISLRRFAIDAYEVTVARFRRFWANRPSTLASIRATPVVFPGGQSVPWTLTAATPGSGAGCNWSPTPTTAERERHPMNCVDWTLAMEFCVWDGGRLPTEAEWEYAARGWATAGLAPGRSWPWGEHDPTQADIASMMNPDPDAGQVCPYAHWSPCPGQDGRLTRRVGLGALGAPAGLFDLAGNVGEWTASAIADYGDLCWTERDRDPLCVGTSMLRVWRGGAYDARMMSELRASMRPGRFADERSPTLGFRCARTR